MKGLAILTLAIGSSIFLSACQTPEPKSGILIEAAPVIGRPAPDFAINGLEGVEKLSDLRGQFVIINFWASWCTFCRREMPALEAIYQEYQDQGVLVLGVNVRETAAQVEQFRKEVPFTFPITLDRNGQIFEKSYWGTAIPTSFFVNREGLIVYISYGEMTYEQIEYILLTWNAVTGP